MAFLFWLAVAFWLALRLRKWGLAHQERESVSRNPARNPETGPKWEQDIPISDAEIGDDL